MRKQSEHPGIDKQHIGTGCPYAVDKHLTALHTPISLIRGVYLAVCIVCLQYDKLTPLGHEHPADTDTREKRASKQLHIFHDQINLNSP